MGRGLRLSPPVDVGRRRAQTGQQVAPTHPGPPLPGPSPAEEGPPTYHPPRPRETPTPSGPTPGFSPFLPGPSCSGFLPRSLRAADLCVEGAWPSGLQVRLRDSSLILRVNLVSGSTTCASAVKAGTLLGIWAVFGGPLPVPSVSLSYPETARSTGGSEWSLGTCSRNHCAGQSRDRGGATWTKILPRRLLQGRSGLSCRLLLPSCGSLPL